MIKDHSNSERGNPLPPPHHGTCRHGLLFPINSNGSFICTMPDRIAHTTGFVTPVVEHWLEREIAQWVHPIKDWSDDPSHHERTLLVLPRSYISLLGYDEVGTINTVEWGYTLLFSEARSILEFLAMSRLLAEDSTSWKSIPVSPNILIFSACSISVVIGFVVFYDIVNNLKCGPSRVKLRLTYVRFDVLSLP